MRLIMAIILGTCTTSCGLYNQNIMFSTKESILHNQPNIELQVKAAEQNYLIQKNDFLEVRVYTQDGEVIIDPPQIDSNQPANNNFNQGNINNTQGNLQNTLGNQISGNTFPLQYPNFLVRQDGYAKLPLIGEVRLENLTLDEADSLLEKKYEEFYEKPFVRTRYSNKKVVVFKGNQGLLFPLKNEKVNLIDVLAQTGGVSSDLRASNIRLIRGDLRDPDIYVINLRTIDGLKQYDLTIEPNDIIYVEPVRKPFVESLKDISPVLSLVTSVVALVLLFRNNN